MKKMQKMLLLAGCIAVFGLGTARVSAQGRGNFDFAQMREERINRLLDEMNVSKEDEKKAIGDAIGKVMDAQMETRFGGRGFGGGGRRNRGNNESSDSNSNNNNNNNNRRRFGTPSPEAEDLQKALEEKAPTDEIKAKLAKLREANKAKEDKLEQAQADLRKLLTSRQEAVAVLNGLLK